MGQRDAQHGKSRKYHYFTLEADTPRVVLDAVGLSFVDAHRGAVFGLAIVTVSAGIIPTRPAAGFDLHLLAVEGRAVGAGLEVGGAHAAPAADGAADEGLKPLAVDVVPSTQVVRPSVLIDVAHRDLYAVLATCAVRADFSFVRASLAD